MEKRVQRNMGALAMTLDYDAELMLRVKDGDGASFAVLLEKHRTSVVHFLYRMVQNHGVAEELAQEVFLRVYRSRESYEASAKFTTWLFRIATHLALNALRDGRNERLQEKQRAAVLMHKYEEMEYSQIARVLSCSESAVKSLLFRAYETLRARLAHMA